MLGIEDLEANPLFVAFRDAASPLCRKCGKRFSAFKASWSALGKKCCDGCIRVKK